MSKTGTHQKKLEASIAYLKSRNKYILTPGTNSPNWSAATDVTKTWAAAEKNSTTIEKPQYD